MDIVSEIRGSKMSKTVIPRIFDPLYSVRMKTAIFHDIIYNDYGLSILDVRKKHGIVEILHSADFVDIWFENDQDAMIFSLKYA